MSRRKKAISLFSGVGGMDLGFARAGYDLLAHVDNDRFCYESLCRNFSKKRVLFRDIFHLSGEELLSFAGIGKGDADILIGGPSCQPFSRSNEGKRLGTKDPRGMLIFEFVRMVREIQPEAFLMENVLGLKSSNGGRDFKRLISRFRAEGYNVKAEVLNAADYGVPQKRHRLFIIGAKSFDPSFPERTHIPPEMANGLKPYVTSGEAIGDLDNGEDCDAKTTVGGKYGSLINRVPPGSNYLHFTREKGCRRPIFRWRSKFWHFLIKLSPDHPSSTIQATPGPYVGPFHWRNRRLTIAEIKRLQTIPDTRFVSGLSHPEHYSEAWKQVGNAVPTRLAYCIANAAGL